LLDSSTYGRKSHLEVEGSMNELELLQGVRLKGRVSIADLAATLTSEPDAVGIAIEELAQSGLVLSGKTLKLSPAGRKRLSELLDAERSQLDHDAVAGIYAAFRPVNAEFKTRGGAGSPRART
jgi:hypothetical protein